MNDTKFALLLGLITGCTDQQDYEETGEARMTKLVEAAFADAIQYPELALAMHRQLDPGFMARSQQLYIAEIVMEGSLYLLVGSYDQWRAFFCARWSLLAGWSGVVMSHN